MIFHVWPIISPSTLGKERRHDFVSLSLIHLVESILLQKQGVLKAVVDIGSVAKECQNIKK